MGSLIPNPMDQEIVFRLNETFSGTAFLALRNHHDGGGATLFDAGNQLSRIARRIGTYPSSRDDTDPNHTTMPRRRNPRARWYHFLELLEAEHDPTSASSPTTAYAIKTVLRAAVTNTIAGKNIVGVVFNVTYATTPSGHASMLYLYPDNTTPGQVFEIGQTGTHVLFLTLICQHHIPGGPVSHPNNPGPNEVVPVAGMIWPSDDQDQNQP